MTPKIDAEKARQAVSFFSGIKELVPPHDVLLEMAKAWLALHDAKLEKMPRLDPQDLFWEGQETGHNALLDKIKTLARMA